MLMTQCKGFGKEYVFITRNNNMLRSIIILIRLASHDGVSVVQIKY